MGCVRKDGDKYFVTVKSDDITATGGPVKFIDTFCGL